MSSVGSGRRPLFLDRVPGRRHRPDYWLLIISTVLLAIGLIVVYTIGPGLAAQNHVGDNYFVNRQFIAALLGVGAFIVCSKLPLTVWRRLETPLLVVAGVSALAVRVLGQQVNGAYRWIQIGGISFQAAEIIKFALIIWLAGFLVSRLREGNLNDFNKSFKPLLIALGLIGLVVAKLQSDLGSTGVMVAAMAVMVYVAGLPMKRIMMIGGVIMIGTILLIASTSYRRDRLFTFMHPNQDCLSTGYQACEALISVGSGGMFGLGLAKSVQAYGYLPEAANDSIFAIYAEKFGFVGVCILLGFFVALFARLKRIIERAPDDYSRLIVTGILAWFSTQALINIGAMIGLLPLKGITLPFISYGGTSLIFVSAAIGLAFQISHYTNLESPRARKETGYGASNYAAINFSSRRT